MYLPTSRLMRNPNLSPGMQPGMSAEMQPGMDDSMQQLMAIMRLQAPQSPMGGAQLGGIELPGAPPGVPGSPPGSNAPPSAQASTAANRQKIADSLMQSGGAQMAQSGSPASSVLGGAMQGLGLGAQLTGKSPMSMLKNMMGPAAGEGGLSATGLPAGATGAALPVGGGLGGAGAAGVEALMPAAGLDAGMGLGAGAGAGAGISAAELGLGAGTAEGLAAAAPAIPAALEGGALASATPAAAGLGPVGWGGLGAAGLMALFGNDLFG